MTKRIELLNWLLSEKSEVLLQDGLHRVGFFSSILADMYSQDLVEMSRDYVEIDALENLNLGVFNRQASEVFATLTNTVNRISDSISLFTILGSYSDLNLAEGWSDVDTFMVVKDSCISNVESFLSLRTECIQLNYEFKKLCPLQHHGVIAVCESDLQSYSSHNMPISVLRNSKSVYLENPLRFSIDNTNEYNVIRSLEGRIKYMEKAFSTGIYEHHPWRGEGLAIDGSNFDNGMYQLFCLMGYTMTLPAYFMDAIELSCLKEQSFELSKQYLDVSRFGIVDLFSSIRKDWPKYEGTKYTPNHVPGWVRNQLGDSWFRHVYEFTLYVCTRAKEINGARY